MASPLFMSTGLVAGMTVMTAVEMAAGAAFEVSVPLLIVFIVALGLFSVRERVLTCFIATCAFSVNYYIAERQKTVVEDIDAVGIRLHLMYGLGRWIFDLLFSASLAKGAYLLLPRRRRTVGLLCSVLPIAAVACFMREIGTETSTVHSVTRDLNILFYFHSSVVVGSIRAGLQFGVILSGAMLNRWQKLHMMAQCSSVLIQNIVSYDKHVFDVILQAELMAYLCLTLCPFFRRILFHQNLPPRHQQAQIQLDHQQHDYQAPGVENRAVQENHGDPLNWNQYQACVLLPDTRSYRSIRKYYPFYNPTVSTKDRLLYASHPELAWPENDIVPDHDSLSQPMDYVDDICAVEENLLNGDPVVDVTNNIGVLVAPSLP